MTRRGGSSNTARPFATTTSTLTQQPTNMTQNTQPTPQYRVGPKGGICVGPNSTYFGPNALIPNTLLDERSRSRLLASRSIFRDGDAVPQQITEKLPGVGIGDNRFAASEGGAETPAQGAARTQGAKAQIAEIEAARAAGAVKPVEPVKSVEVVRAPGDIPAHVKAQAGTPSFTHDPDGLVALPIDELRRLVKEVDAAMEVDHLDEVELIGILSSEYVAPEATAPKA